MWPHSVVYGRHPVSSDTLRPELDYGLLHLSWAILMDPMGKTCEKRLGFQTTPFSTNQMATNKGSRAQISKVPLVNLPVCEILIGGIPLCRFKDWDWDVHWIFPDINRYQLLINHQTTSLWCRPLSLELQFLMLLLPELLQHPILLPH